MHRRRQWITPVLNLFLIFALSETTKAQTLSQPSQHNGSVPLDSSSEQAVRETQSLLRNREAREKAISQDAKAREHDQKITGVLGNQKEKAYELSAQLTETLARESGGDPKKLQELMNGLMANPQLLEKYLNPSQRNEIRSMASEIESQQKAPPSAPSR